MNAPDRRPPLPIGFRIVLDGDTRRLAEDLLFGGMPGRVLRLSAAGVACLDRLAERPVDSVPAGRLARSLTDAGLAHPQPPQPPQPPSSTVIVPARDRPAMLDRCLAALAGGPPVLVVDDASRDAAGIAAIAARHGARLLRLERNGGPAAARNAGLRASDSELVAFLDSDCVPGPGWIEELLPQFGDPALGAVAPRIVALPGTDPVSRYSAANSSLDLGDRQALVRPGGRVGYLPTAALLVRRAALAELPGGPFDERLRVGEDVDLVWRLIEAGWRVRYQPASQVGHEEPATFSALLARRFRYGTSAAALAGRHPAAISPLRLHLLPAITVAAALGRRPVAAGLGLAASIASASIMLRRAGVPRHGVIAAMVRATSQTWLGLGHYSTQFAAPLLLAGLLRPRLPGELARPGRSVGRRLALASLLLGPPLSAWLGRRPALDPARYLAASIADDIAYGSGVWAGCLAERSLIAIRPSLIARPLRIQRQPASTAGP